MNVLEFATRRFGSGSVAAGFIGALTGLGGGVVIVPLLALVFGVDMRYAIGASLISVIATSSGAAAAYVREGYSNLRVGMFLEIATTLGALGGAFLATVVPTGAIAVVFGVVLLISAYLSSRNRPEQLPNGRPDRIATWLRMDSTYPTPTGLQKYHVHNVPIGFALMIDRRRAFGPAGHWIGRIQGAGDGSGHEVAVQGVDDDEQFHDRRDRGGERRHLFEPRLHRARIGDAGDAGRAGGLGSRNASSRRRGAANVANRVHGVGHFWHLAIEMIYKGLDDWGIVRWKMPAFKRTFDGTTSGLNWSSAICSAVA